MQADQVTDTSTLRADLSGLDDSPPERPLGTVGSEPFDVEPPYVAEDAQLPDDRFLDRELSWLAFNQRVLELAEDENLPLLERVRFAAIFASNLDEFFMVRVAGLKRRIAAGVAVPAASGLRPREVLEGIWRQSRALMERHGRLFHDELVPTLGRAGIDLLRWADLTDEERDSARDLFVKRIYPVLTPLAVDPAHPFPYISGLSLNLAVSLRNPSSGTAHFARVKVPPIFPRWVLVGDQRYVPLEDVIAAHLDLLFAGMTVVSHHTFRVTRNEDLEVEEDDAENLLQALEKELLRRRFGPPVRLEVEESIDPHVLDLLVSELDVGGSEVIALPGPLDLSCLATVADVDRPELSFRPFVPGTHTSLAEVETASPADMFSALSRKDVLVHHPYESLTASTQRLIEQAAEDPDVMAIKLTV